MQPRLQDTLVVIGGGAAGIFCAVNAARRRPSLRVIVLEKSTRLLSKVKISGGGRCNVTHACDDPAAMSRCYPRGGAFVRKAFHRFFTTDTIDWFEARGVRLKTEPDGRMFPVTDRSQTIIDCLLREAERYDVGIRTRCEVTALERSAEGFTVRLATGETIPARFVCVAVGGYSRAAAFDWLRSLGHRIEEPVPSLFTFNLTPEDRIPLPGVSVPHARVRIAGMKLEAEGPVLVTHWGLSGPAVLRLSAWGARALQEMQWQFGVRVNWIPDHKEPDLRNYFQEQRVHSGSRQVTAHPLPEIPARLWSFLAAASGIPDGMRWADVPATAFNRFIKLLTDWEGQVSGKTTFKEEFVTAGGIALTDVDPQTMQSKQVAGLYFAGEVLDVDGITGGYNFQHAWTSGWIAAAAITSA